MKRTGIVFLMLLSGYLLNAQKKPVNQFADVAVTVGQSQGSVAGAYVYNWQLGKQKKWEIGVGARITSYFGTKKDFITAGPAKLTRTSTTPFLIFFAGQKIENFDTLQVQRPLVFSTNITANIGYHISSKLYAGFNIDIIGFSIGRKESGIFTGTNQNGQQGSFTDNAVKPTAFNILLTGDHDRGTLNSEFFLKYNLTDKIAIRGIYQFLFVEYTTSAVQQKAPDGTIVARFRNKANNFGLGFSYKL
jgi:hypothetical protein